MREGSFFVALMPFRRSDFGSSGPFRGDRAREREGAVLGDNCAATTAAVKTSAARRIYAGGFEMPQGL